MSPSMICAVEIEPLVESLGYLEWQPSGEPGCFSMLHAWPVEFPVGVVVSDVMGHYDGRSCGEILISRVVPGQHILEHRDALEHDCRSRVHVPIVTNAKARFTIEGVAHHMKAGTAYEIDPTELHGVVNRGETDRIHLIFNVI